MWNDQVSESFGFSIVDFCHFLRTSAILSSSSSRGTGSSETRICPLSLPPPAPRRLPTSAAPPPAASAVPARRASATTTTALWVRIRPKPTASFYVDSVAHVQYAKNVQGWEAVHVRARRADRSSKRGAGVHPGVHR